MEKTCRMVNGYGPGSSSSIMVRIFNTVSASSFCAVLTLLGTVVSIQENPYPRPSGPLPEKEVKSVLGIVRRNTRFIFSGVSKQHFASSESDSLVTIRVRNFRGGGPDQASIKQEDSSSLLFYYIFDDWVSSYGLIAKREHKYGVSLDQLVRPSQEFTHVVCCLTHCRGKTC